MARIKLSSGEVLIGQGMMALRRKWGFSSRMYRGTIYVTNQRVCFYISMVGNIAMNLGIAEIEGFTEMRMLLFIPGVTIHSLSGERYTVTGFPAKKLQQWLSQIGVSRLDLM